uniref:Titin n=1 Tax=Oryzias sinensis TaxID=183150 RepID=A0A8C7ZV12_9TELE
MCTPPTGIQTTKLTVTELKEGGEYQFRICAVNSEGVGEAANVQGTVITSDKTEAPEIELDADLRKVVSVRAGGTLRLFVTIRGRPEPVVKWEKIDDNLTERAAVDTTSSYTMLVIDNVNRFDSGKYSLTLTNSSGTKTAVIVVRILDSPSAPQHFTVKEIKKDSVILTWDTPLNDGGAKITNYIVEKRESVRKAYTTVTINCTANTLKIEELPEGGIFYFRVSAVNTLKINADLAGYPAPVVYWTKDDKEIELRARIKIVLTDTSTSLIIKDSVRGDSGQYALTLRNIAGKVTLLIFPLSIWMWFNTRLDPQTHYIVKAGKDVELCVPLKGRPAPIASWSKEEECIDCNPKYEFHHSDSTTVLVMRDVTRLDTGKYTVKIQNGVGEPKTLTLSVKVQDTPAQCRNLVLKDVSRGKVTLVWERPLLDGGADITNYIVEKRDSSKRSYSAVTNKCTDTTYTIEDLSEKTSYFFRVLAENENGVGDPCDTREPVKATETPGPVKEVSMKDSSKTSVTLQWLKPDYDGGSIISDYVIEKKMKDEEWSLGGTSRQCELEVKKLKEHSEMFFRVAARNEKGQGDFVEVGPIKVIDYIITPEADLSEYPNGTINIRLGHNLHIELPYKGKPRPSASWLKDNVEYEFRVMAVNDAGVGAPSNISIPIKAAEPKDIPCIYNVKKMFVFLIQPHQAPQQNPQSAMLQLAQ